MPGAMGAAMARKRARDKVSVFSHICGVPEPSEFSSTLCVSKSVTLLEALFRSVSRPEDTQSVERLPIRAGRQECLHEFRQLNLEDVARTKYGSRRADGAQPKRASNEAAGEHQR